MSEPVEGWVAPELAAELPGLGLTSVTLPARTGPSPRAVRRRLDELSTRFRGPHAVAMRRLPVPHAYRAFFRQVGLDPDRQRPPGEALALERLLAGEFPSRGRLDDALAIALIETGVPVWALDADALEGTLGLRPCAGGERLGRGRDAPALPAGRLVVADAAGPLAVMFAEPARGVRVTARTVRATLFAVRVAGVPAIHVEEALWTCAGVLGGG